jgi:hypothetical protein
MKSILLLTCMVATLIAADATGSWTGTLTETTSGQDQPHPAHLVLKQEGAALTGTAGPDADSQRPIAEGKVSDGTLTFSLADANGTVMKFTLKLEGDEIKGDVRGEGGGSARTARLSVKRDKSQ